MDFQVSLLSREKTSVHWFTGTPDPSVSFFKPFIFTARAQSSPHTISPDEVISSLNISSININISAIKQFFFLSQPPREHRLYKLHMDCMTKKDADKAIEKVRQMETNRIAEIEELIQNQSSEQNTHDLDNLFKDCVETEIELYEKC